MKNSQIIRTSAIILAAGFSSRMGRFKALLPLGDRAMIEHAVALFRTNGVDVIVVTGYRGEELSAFLKPAGVRVAFNPDFARGMFSSVQTGARNLGSDSQGFFVLPVDIPLVRSWTIHRLLQAFAHDPRCIIHPCFNGRRGHPPLIPAALAPAVLDWLGTDGLHGCLDRYEALSVNVEVPDRHIHLDSDTPEDYEQLVAASRRQDIPTAAECDHLLSQRFAVSRDIVDHSRRVAEVVGVLAAALIEAGENPDLDMLHAAAMLHDVAKGHPHHAQLGAQWLGEMGFGRIGSIVAAHTDPEPVSGHRPTEKELVFLADKLVHKDQLISIEQRFDTALERHGHIPEAYRNIGNRREAARRIACRIEQITGKKIDDLLHRLQQS
jgi:molybdenum cofactor cytidylyltransferase